MIDVRHYSRQFLTEFIELYKSLPCLWKKKSKDYTNRALKSVCYKKMVDKLRKVEPNATREVVIKKINSIRVCRRKEWIKVQNSIRSGSEVYTPALWYYDLLNFIEECDEPDDRTSDDHNNIILLEDPISSPGTQIVKTEVVAEMNRLSSEDNVSESNSNISQYTIEYHDDYDFPGASHNSTPVHDHTRPPKRKLTQSSYVDSVAEGYGNDRFDIFGKSVAMKMRDLPTQQRLLAEKIINDTLFKAEMGILRLSDAMDHPPKSN